MCWWVTVAQIVGAGPWSASRGRPMTASPAATVSAARFTGTRPVSHSAPKRASSACTSASSCASVFGMASGSPLVPEV